MRTRVGLRHDLGPRLLRSGYRALPEERARHDGADVFSTTLLGRRAVVVRGREGAELFYDSSVVERRRAVPAPLAHLLFGRGAVHGLDDDEHRQRKAMFLEVLADERTRPLAEAIGADLRRRSERWAGRDVRLFDELVEVYGAAVQAWAGIDSDARAVGRQSRRLAAIVDGFGGAGRAYPRAWRARTVANRWARALVEEARAGRCTTPPGSALQVLATGAGRELSPPVAGVELLNILRPTVAVAWPATFLARALVEHPRWRPQLRDDPSGERRTAFGHEVRRTCPFVPGLAARARSRAEIGGTALEPGDFLVLDVPGTHQDPRHWYAPEEFLPERFAGVWPDPFAFVPQGGGDPSTGHRCPGEALTVAILNETAAVLADLDYRIVGTAAHDPERIPTLPAGGLTLRVGA